MTSRFKDRPPPASTSPLRAVPATLALSPSRSPLPPRSDDRLRPASLFHERTQRRQSLLEVLPLPLQLVQQHRDEFLILDRLHLAGRCAGHQLGVQDCDLFGDEAVI